MFGQVKKLKKRLDEVSKDNDDLLCAVKYLKSKMEQKDATSRCATPTVEARPPTPVGRAPPFVASQSAVALVGDQLIELRELREKCTALETEKMKLLQQSRG
jgi:hypothetical protein